MSENTIPITRTDISHLGFSRNRSLCHYHQQEACKVLLKGRSRLPFLGRCLSHVLVEEPNVCLFSDISHPQSFNQNQAGWSHGHLNYNNLAGTDVVSIPNSSLLSPFYLSSINTQPFHFQTIFTPTWTVYDSRLVTWLASGDRTFLFQRGSRGSFEQQERIN